MKSVRKCILLYELWDAEGRRPLGVNPLEEGAPAVDQLVPERRAGQPLNQQPHERHLHRPNNVSIVEHCRHWRGWHASVQASALQSQWGKTKRHFAHQGQETTASSSSATTSAMCDRAIATMLRSQGHVQAPLVPIGGESLNNQIGVLGAPPRKRMVHLWGKTTEAWPFRGS